VNRKERRASRKQGKAGTAPGVGPSALGANFLASAIQHYRAGQLGEAERLCRDALMFDRKDFRALHLLGVLAAHAGNFEGAAEILGKSLDANQQNPECHFHRADVLRILGRNYDAQTHLLQATEQKPDYVAAHVALGDILGQLGDLDQARRCFERALAIDPTLIEALNGAANVALLQGRMTDAAHFYRAVVVRRPLPEAHSNLGLSLASQGQWEEAIQHYRQAIAIKPDLVDVYRNLASALLVTRQPAQALAAVREGFRYAETQEARSLFVQCLCNLPLADVPLDDDLRVLVARALTEGWHRTTMLAALAASLIKRRTAGRLDTLNLAELAGDDLLHALLVSAPIPDAEIERRLTAIRSEMLQQAAAAPPDGAPDTATLAICCALARQCFINEYVYAESEADTALAAQVQKRLEGILATGAAMSPLQPAALACFIPLSRLSNAPALLTRAWPDALNAVLDQQLREPQLEQEIRSGIPVLTTVEDEVSIKVRQQYEEMPYPRWVQTVRPGRPMTIDSYLRSQFPAAPIRPFTGGRDGLDILIAGCGTGQHAIETAQRLAGSRMLAIDLSMNSLAYAARKTREHGVRGITYAQADILKLGQIHRSFDVIESSGVLHHLGDPMQGWRVLVSLLRPGGFMHIGLYSTLARSSVRAARQFIAERGYQSTAPDIRRCRQELLACADDNPLKDATRFEDFYTTSECRDLLFHVRENQMTLPMIKDFLQESRLIFLGFSGLAAEAYRVRFPNDRAMTDLDNWHAFECDNPLTFVGMYQFWVQKPAP
jgi:tetratricopeptide (TPR) repeat protein/2-polyprenyl-3-methyl-5-hydroxy-6-metoxy-1,4-benzoquinol methylase